jgi:hypothetical protein
MVAQVPAWSGAGGRREDRKKFAQALVAVEEGGDRAGLEQQSNPEEKHGRGQKGSQGQSSRWPVERRARKSPTLAPALAAKTRMPTNTDAIVNKAQLMT